MQLFNKKIVHFTYFWSYPLIISRWIFLYKRTEFDVLKQEL